MIFSLDASISFALALFGLLVFATVLAGTGESARGALESFELEEKTLMIADSLVKNYDANNTILGACIVDTDKKRVLSNELSEENLRKAKAQTFGDIFVKSVNWKTKTTSGALVLAAKDTSSCLVARRLALIDGKKGTVEVTVCREEE